jgi:hypothetical protein
MAKWELIIRRKPVGNEDIAKVHAAFVSALESLPEPWRLQKPMPLSIREGDLGTTISLRGKLGRGITGYAHYVLRSESYWEDTAQYDDHFVFEFDPNKIEIGLVSDIILPKLVKSLNAYRASVEDTELLLREWPALAEQIETSGVDLNGRYGVSRFSPIAYYGSSLLQLGLHISAKDLASRQPQWFSIFHNGVLIKMPIPSYESSFFEDANHAIRSVAS